MNDDDWILESSNFRKAWGITPPRPDGRSRGEGITVLQIDTGYTAHPELLQEPSRYLIGPPYAQTFISPDDPFAGGTEGEDPLPPLTGTFRHPGHGTRAASVLMSAEGKPDPAAFPGYESAKAVHGVAPMAALIPYRVTHTVVLDDEHVNFLGKAIYFALKELEQNRLDINEVGVISISLGCNPTTAFTPAERNSVSTALLEARKKGIVVCGAAGQGTHRTGVLGELWDLVGQIGPAFPALDPNVICCAGCTHDNKPMKGACVGKEVDISAPAVDVWIASPWDYEHSPDMKKDEAIQSWGTSYATPVVAGACALWQAHHGRRWLLDPANYGPSLVLPLFREVLRKSAYTPPGWDQARHGVGILDAEEMLRTPLPARDAFPHEGR